MSFNWQEATQLTLSVGGGQIPTHRHFRRLDTPLWIFGSGVHSNPRFYKHYWRIWTRDDAIADEDVELLRQQLGPYPWLALVPELSFHNAMCRMKELCGRGEVFIVLDERVKRDDPAAPWDIPLIRAKGGRVAPAYDADDDTPFFGHK